MTPTPPLAQHWTRTGRLAVAMFAATALLGCVPGTGGHEPFSVHEITPTALLARAARDPALAADAHGTVALVWVADESRRAELWLSVSRDSGVRFTPPVRVDVAAGRVVSTPENRPAVALGPSGALAIAWSEWRADSTGAIDLRVRASADFGHTFGRVTTVNDDTAGPPPGLRWRQRRDWDGEHRTNAFHGFAALAFTPDAALLVSWLDDRRTPAPAPARRATLWRAISTDGGQSWSPNSAVSDSASPGCRPALAVADDGAVALAFRDAANDLRDPRLALSADGGRVFSVDTLISLDRWNLPDCADHGPAITWDHADGGHYFWYTGAPPAGVYAVRWRRTGGAAGLRRPAADSLANADHPVAATLGGMVLVGVEAPAPGPPVRHPLAVCGLDDAGTWSPWTFLGAEATSAALASVGTESAIACWIEHEPARSRLRLATLTRRSRPRG